VTRDQLRFKIDDSIISLRDVTSVVDIQSAHKHLRYPSIELQQFTDKALQHRPCRKV